MAELFVAERSGARGARRRVVLKRMLQSYAEDPELRGLFIHEARIAMQLSHANIVQVFDFEERPDGFVLEMELVDGCDLRRLLRAGGPLPAGAMVFVTRQLLKALDYAHRRDGADGLPLQIVHRDVTPGNVLISREGEVKLTDFGLARSRDRGLSTPGLKGTFAFMAPEQAEERELDARADLFAVGACAYAMLTGKGPFEADGPLPTLDRLRHGQFEPLGSVAPELAAVVHRALAREPGERFQTAAEFRGALDAAAAGLRVDESELVARVAAAAGEGVAAPKRNTVRAGREARPSRHWPYAALAALLLAALSAAWGWRAPSPVLAHVASTLRAAAPVARAPATPVLARAEEKVAVARASLTVSAEPWAHVRVDGRAVGTTPVRHLSLAAGTHEVVLENPALKATRSLLVKLRPGEERTVVENLAGAR